jgi:hypothetical protein
MAYVPSGVQGFKTKKTLAKHVELAKPDEVI